VPHRRPRARLLTTAAVAVGVTATVVAASLATSSANTPKPQKDRSNDTASPIKHLVVLFDENISYDHYFGTYPKAANTDGTKFYAVSSTPKTNNLVTSGSLTSNPNLYYPKRLTSTQALTCDQNHGYNPEQNAEDGGAMDKFVQNVSVDTCTGAYGAPGLTMDYYDGNTVTGLWNYAQQYALSDNSYDTTFGPSTPGALNLVSGQTHGFREVDSVTGQQVPTPGSYVLLNPDKNGVGTVINDPDPAYDDCSDKNHTSTDTLAAATGQNIGDLLNARGVSWGWFQGGFAPTTPAGNGATYAVCGATHNNIGGASVVDYSPHHNPFEYYQSTSNPHHLPPTGLSEVGHNGQANHEYDLTWFNKAVQSNKLPAVSFVKAPEYQDGHAGYSDPIDEQHFLVAEINKLQKSPEWKSTAVVVADDDSDGWYDHQYAAPLNGSNTSQDEAACTSQAAAGGYEGRCGPGPRLPLMVISPWARTNYIDHHATEQTSILKFVEDNWFTGRIGDSSFDARAGNLKWMFDFTQSNDKRVLLKQNGSIKSITPIKGNRSDMRATAVVTKH
jgi:phospholipase C